VNVRLLPAPPAIVAPVVPALVPPIAPVTVPQVAVPAGVQVAGAVSVTPDGSRSVTVTFAAFDGPPLVTTMVYVAVPPGVYDNEPSLLVAPRLTTAAMESESVAVLLPGFGSTTPAGGPTVAVLVSVPVAAALSVALSV
jgi:hypothetical protein